MATTKKQVKKVSTPKKEVVVAPPTVEEDVVAKKTTILDFIKKNSVKIIIGVVIVISLILFLTMFKGCYKPDTKYKIEVAEKEREIEFIKKQRIQDSLQLIKKDSVIEVYQNQIQIRDELINHNKIRINELDEKIRRIPYRVRNMSKDSLRAAALAAATDTSN